MVKSAGEEIERKMEAEKEGDYHALGAGIVGGDLRSREELLTGGREGWVREKREEEERGGRRLV